MKPRLDNWVERANGPAGNRRCSRRRGQEEGPRVGGFVEELWLKKQGEISCLEREEKGVGRGNAHISRWEESAIDKERAQLERGPAEFEDTENTFLKYKWDQATSPPRLPHRLLISSPWPQSSPWMTSPTSLACLLSFTQDAPATLAFCCPSDTWGSFLLRALCAFWSFY